MKIKYLGPSSPIEEFLESLETMWPYDLSKKTIEVADIIQPIDPPDLIVSYNHDQILTPEELVCPAINLHIGFLPWNRGAHPNIWAWINGTPHGITIHYIDRGIDTGDIILQERVYMKKSDHTLRSSYLYLHARIQACFMQNWSEIRMLPQGTKQPKGVGSFHKTKNFEQYLPYIRWDMRIEELFDLVFDIDCSVEFRNKMLEEINEMEDNTS